MDIKVFISFHKPFYEPSCPMLHAIQVGSSIAPMRLPGILHDDEGENISDKNPMYCELTAQYWVWKNVDADYYGFFHYRRYLALNDKIKNNDVWGVHVEQEPCEALLNDIGVTEQHLKEACSKYDVITAFPRDYRMTPLPNPPKTIREDYGFWETQRQSDLDTALEVLKERYPEFMPAAEHYLESDAAYECNMFIMRKDVFLHYSEWLFTILSETAKRSDYTLYSKEEYRVLGFLGERLFGIYYTWLKQSGKLCMHEVTKVLFRRPDAVTVEPLTENAVAVVLAAGAETASYVDVTLRSIAEHADPNRFYDLIVLYKELPDDVIQRLQRGYPKHISVRAVRLAKGMADGMFGREDLLNETYFRFFVPTILRNYSKVVCLGADVVVNRDIAELFSTNADDVLLAACRDIDIAGQLAADPMGWQSYFRDVMNLKDPSDYFQTGVLVLNLRKMRAFGFGAKACEALSGHDWRCPEQDVLNALAVGQVHYLPQQWNTLANWWEQDCHRFRMDIFKRAPHACFDDYLIARKDPYAVRFSGAQKPWDAIDCDFSDYFWRYARLSPWYEHLLRRIYCVPTSAAADNSAPDEGIWELENANVYPRTPVKRLRGAVKQFLPYGFMVRRLNLRCGIVIDKPLLYYPGFWKRARRLVKFALPYIIVMSFRKKSER